MTWHNEYSVDRGVVWEEAARRLGEELASDPDTFSGFYLSHNPTNDVQFPVLVGALLMLKG